jgi:pimeloyl-ACP methyl ester carboxylesterase
LTAADLEVLRIGTGPPVVLVHGSIIDGSRTWRHQLSLGDRWELRVPNRPGFGRSSALPRGDFEAEAPLIARLLEDGAHLVGHSYGAVIALLAAAQRPEAVRSLTVSEPGCLRVGAGDRAVDLAIARGEELYRRRAEIAPRDFLVLFRAGVHSAHETPAALPEWLEHGTQLLMRERPPWEAEIPFDRLAPAPFRTLVISGAHSPVFETVCDILAERLAAQRAVIPGRGHTIPATGVLYNQCLDRFLTACQRS